jgi:S-adenosylmethionine/arginine decarboxylase-like enzyme
MSLKGNLAMGNLGKVMNLQAYSLVGKMNVGEWSEMLMELCEAMDMHPVLEGPYQWTYPTEEGKGGFGMTMVLPITESFIALDTWPDHKGAYLMICSCRPFDVHKIKKVLKVYGAKISEEVGNTLRIEK